MDSYNEALRVLLDLVSQVANEHDRITRETLNDLAILLDGIEEEADRLEMEQGEVE